MTTTSASGSGLLVTIPWWHMLAGARLLVLDAEVARGRKSA